MNETGLRFRQIHLDFHTSEDITGIGSQFDPEEFAATLERARVDSVTCFARCHHGWIYYDTKLNPERRHPHLTCDLLREQIQACHARGIRVPVYTTCQWDRLTATEHPEWLEMGGDGTIRSNPPFGPGFYARLCLSSDSPYVAFLKAHVQEILEELPVDGFFFDIVQPQNCACPRCRARMRAEGLDPADEDARRRFGAETINRFQELMSAFVCRLRADATIFYNAGHVGPRHRRAADAYSHFELESLPGGGWGYLHFPLTMRYARTLAKECTGQTGKFHTAWGDFHSLKNQAALEFECFRALALGAKCSIGDQLHPTGRIDQATYDLIGSVYREIEKKEPWCRGTRAVTEIGVLSPEEFSGEGMPAAALGAVRMLQEGGHQFDVLDSQGAFERYRLLILPDTIPVSEELAAKLEAYLRGGGALIASYRSGLSPDGESFALDALGVSLKGDAPFSPDFIRARSTFAAGLPQCELVMYLRGMEVEPRPGSEVLADVFVPYFNRGIRFCSHQHTPSAGVVGYPGAVRSGRAIYLAHPVFTQYQRNAPRWCKQLVLNAVDLLMPDPLVRTDAPTSALVSVNEQPAENRWVFHLLHYIPERRSQDLDVIEDVIPLHDVTVSLRTPRPVRTVACVPGGEPLAFADRDGRIEFALGKVVGHQMVAVEFA